MIVCRGNKLTQVVDQEEEAKKSGSSEKMSSQASLLGGGKTSTAIDHETDPLTVSGVSLGQDDAAGPIPSSPQRVDTNTLEMGRISQTSGTQGRAPRPDPQQRRPAQPLSDK